MILLHDVQVHLEVLHDVHFNHTVAPVAADRVADALGGRHDSIHGTDMFELTVH